MGFERTSFEALIQPLLQDSGDSIKFWVYAPYYEGKDQQQPIYDDPLFASS